MVIEKLNDPYHRSGMSNEKGEDLYEEMEWRVVYDENSKNKHFTRSNGAGIYRLRFKASDVKVIIFPDENVKQMSLSDDTISKHFSQHMPIMATLDDCDNF